MASRMYPTAKAAFLSGQIDVINDTIMATLVHGADEPYNAAEQFFSSVTDYTGVTPVELVVTSVADGIVLADPTRWLAVDLDVDKTVDAIVVYKEGAGAGSSPLIAYIDVTPFEPNGGDVLATWHATNGVFKLNDSA